MHPQRDLEERAPADLRPADHEHQIRLPTPHLLERIRTVDVGDLDQRHAESGGEGPQIYIVGMAMRMGQGQRQHSGGSDAVPTQDL
jgi:hypothetical protein